MSAFRWIALGGVLLGVLARLVVSHEPTPGFGFNPLVQVPPEVGMGPTASLVLDALTLMASALLLWCEHRLGRRVHLGIVLLALAGGAIALAHSLLIDGLTIEALRLGGSWTSAIVGAVAVWHAARDPVVRRAVAGLLLCAVLVLIVKGLMQVLIEHPATVANFKANREAMLAAQGMSIGSPQALAFERRLNQPDATGWLGLTNVYFSLVLAAGLASAVALRDGWAPMKAAEGRAGKAAMLGLAAIAGGSIALVLAGPVQGGSIAKGPAGALVLSAALLATAWLGRQRDWALWWIGLAALALPLVAVVARGLAGDALGELSLRFRWFYLQGAARIFMDAPLLGVGPDGFQSAYLLAKPELSPEQVTSPHSVLADWLATLGLAGLAWAGLLVAAAVSIARRLGRLSDRAEPTFHARTAMIWTGATLACVLAWNVWHEEWPIARGIPGGAFLMISAVSRLTLVWLVALAAAYGIVRFTSDAGVRTALAGAGLLVLAHAQIEMVLTTPGSVAWAACLIGAAASRDESEPRAGAPLLAIAAILGVAALGGLIGWQALGPVRAWEAHQRQASRTIAEVTRLAQELDPASEPDPERVAAVQSGLRQQFGLARETGLAELLARARFSAVIESARELEQAANRGGQPLSTLRELASLQMASAGLARELGLDPGPYELAAIETAQRAVDRWPERTAGYNALALAARGRWERTGYDADADVVAWALEGGAALDPHGLSFAWSRFELAESMDDSASAAEWAQRCLAIDEKLVLDPVVRLSDDRVRRAKRAIRATEDEPAGGGG